MKRLLPCFATLLGLTFMMPVAIGDDAVSKPQFKSLSPSQIANAESRAKMNVEVVAKEMPLSDEQTTLLESSLVTKYTKNQSQINIDTPNDVRRSIWKETNEWFSDTLSAEFSKPEIRQLSKAIRNANEADRIFNGKNLDGWKQVNGTATYEVIDGEIVGTTATGSPNSFLATEKHYGNFELSFEVFLVNNELNSGVQFRSNQHTEETLASVAKKHTLGRVFGYQCEIEASAEGDMDANKFGDAGYIYDEARRGWIVDDETRTTAKTRNAFRNQKWNRIRISANGDHIQTWINGKKITDIKDDMTASGFIALQVHGIGKKEDKWQVKWRNITLKELP